MTKQAIDLTGRAVGHWTVLGRGRTEPNRKGTRVFWRCRCACGTEREIVGEVLRGERSKSCGCQTASLSRTAHTTHGHSRRTPTYTVWANMIQRCTDPKSKDFPYYGGRGITVTKQWRKFENFLADMG